MEIGLLTERTYRIYKAIYKTLQAEDSVDDFFVASRVPLDTDVAKDPITRERVKKLLDIDKIATKWLAIGWTLTFGWLAIAFLYTFVLPYVLAFLIVFLNYVLSPYCPWNIWNIMFLLLVICIELI